MFAFVATMSLPLQRLLLIPLPPLLLLLLKLLLPYHPFLQIPPLLNQFFLLPLPCQCPMRWHSLRSRALGGRRPTRQRLSRHCPLRCRPPHDPSPHILQFLALPPSLLLSAAWPSARMPPAALRTPPATPPATTSPAALPPAVTLPSVPRAKDCRTAGFHRSIRRAAARCAALV